LIFSYFNIFVKWLIPPSPHQTGYTFYMSMLEGGREEGLTKKKMQSVFIKILQCLKYALKTIKLYSIIKVAA